MTETAKLPKLSFAAGEVTPTQRFASDLRRNQIGVAKAENMIVTIEGNLTRSPGTKFILELKDESKPGRLLPFRYSGNDYYMLVVNDGVARVVRDGGFVATGDVPYEFAVPWADASLPNIRGIQSGDTQFFVDGTRMDLVKRIAANNWTVSSYVAKNGPFDTQNLDQAVTVQAGAVEGVGIALTGTGNPFKAEYVGQPFQITAPTQNFDPLWQPNEDIAQAVDQIAWTTNYLGNSDIVDIANAFSDELTTFCYRDGTWMWIGMSFAPTVPIAMVDVRGYQNGLTLSPGRMRVILDLYGKKGAAPADQTDGTLIGSNTVNDDLVGQPEDSHYPIYTRNPSETWDHCWVVLRMDGPSGRFNLTRVEFMAWRADGEPIRRRSGANTYQAVTGGNSGATAPTHTEGDARAGGGNAVKWRFLHAGYGIVTITGFTDANHATADVVTRLPESAVSGPSYRFAAPAWTSVAGFPTQIGAHQQRLVTGRGNKYWMTKSATTNDYTVTADDAGAIVRELTSPDGSVVDIEWFLASGLLIVGTRDIEWITRAPGNFDALTNTSIRDIDDAFEGSAPHIPVLVDKGIFFIGKSKKRLFYAKVDRLSEEIDPDEISKYARHILAKGVEQLAWQKDPNRVLWQRTSDGKLVGLTFMVKEQIAGWHRHPRDNSFIEDISWIPANDDGEVQVYMIVRRTIDGQTRRYVEMLAPFFAPVDPDNPTAEGAWFVDCGVQYNGAPTMSVGGALHLKGQTVAVFADGSEQQRKTVAEDGTVALDRAASNVVIGIPIRAYVKDLPRETQLQSGPSKGDLKRANHVIVDCLECFGGTVSINGGPTEDLQDTGTAVLGAAIPLQTLSKRVSVGSNSADELVTEIVVDNAGPFTLCGLTPIAEFEGS